jgi:hypothetical protein
LFAPDDTQASEMAIDDRVCECCPSAAAVTVDGPIVAYRNRTSDEIRDIYVSRLIGSKWTRPRAVYNDRWRIAACPVNGPALSARGRDVAIAWFTAVGDEGHVYAAFSSNAGETFGSPVRIDDVGAVGRVDVELLVDGSAAVTWIEFANQRSEFRIRRCGTQRVAIGVTHRVGHLERSLERLSAPGPPWQRADLRVDRCRRQTSGANRRGSTRSTCDESLGRCSRAR